MSYDRFGYVWQNPLMNNDPNGEIISILAVILIAALTGVAISGLVYSVQALIERNWTWSGFGSSLLSGAIQEAGAPFGLLGIVVGGAIL